MTDRKPTSFSEKLVKYWMQREGNWYFNYGEITNLVALHEYFGNREFVFLLELIYDAELGVETIIKWAEDLRKERHPKEEEVV